MKVLKLTRNIMFGFLTLFVSLFLVLALVVGPDTAFRIVYYNDTDIDDYRIFPARTLHASDEPFHFTEDGDSSPDPAEYHGMPFVQFLEADVKPSQAPAYKITEPFQPLLCLVFFTFFAYRHLRGVRGEGLKQEAFRLTALGVAGSVLIDFLAFVLIPHPFAFTFHEFYVDYQPWITLVYVAIYLSPWLAGYMLARKVPAHG